VILNSPHSTSVAVLTEKGFLIGIAQCVKRILTRELYNSDQITAAKQDGSREFISLLSTICTDGTRVPPALIYKGSSRDLQSSWIEDLQESQEAYFASSANGWSSNAFGIIYITTVFDPATQAKTGRGRRLLIVDGHLSHVNLEFLNTCDRLKILVLILPRLAGPDCRTADRTGPDQFVSSPVFFFGTGLKYSSMVRSSLDQTTVRSHNLRPDCSTVSKKIWDRTVSQSGLIFPDRTVNATRISLWLSSSFCIFMEFKAYERYS
jgi:hypothetical protein